MRNICITCCAVFFLLSACNKQDSDVFLPGSKISASQAQIKINYTSLYSDDRAVVIKINGNRVSSLIKGRTPYPGGGLNTWGSNYPLYLATEAGSNKVEVAQPFKDDIGHLGADSTILYSTDVNLEAGNSYILHITDTAANTKSVLTTETDVIPDSGYNTYRFINLMPNVPAIDLYYGPSSTEASTDTLIVSNIKYLEISDYITRKIYPTRYWKIRPAGAELSATTVLASYSSASTYANRRTFTIYSLGYQGLVSPDVRRPWVSFLYVR